MKFALYFLFLVVTVPAGAQTINRCVNPKTGELLFRAQACPQTPEEWANSGSSGGHGSQETGQAMTRAEAEARIESARRSVRQAAAGGAQRQPAGAAIPVQYAHNQGACDAAKSQRKAVLDAVGIRRTHDLLRRLDDAVNNACK